MLVGRDAELQQIAGLLERARAGEAGVLEITGEPGIGKSALLDEAAARAGGMTVSRAVGIESEAQLEFSALFDLCRPLLPALGELPERQAAALANALGVGSGERGDRFVIGAATLSLLAAAAEQGPLLVLVDDAQWIDAASADALRFAARRLAAEPVAIILAARDDEGGGLGSVGVRSIRLEGVDDGAAVALLDSGDGGPLAPDVVERLCRVTAGNPLAILELPGMLSRGQLEGSEAIEGPLPVSSRIREAFAQRAKRLPTDVQAAMLVAAISSTPLLEAVTDAMAQLEIDARALEPAEDAGILEIDAAEVRFRHPLMRSAVVQSAAPSARRRAHRALAAALADRSPEERAWHLAASSVGSDEEAASALAEAAAHIRARSGWAPAALALERSAQLTRDGTARDQRLLDAAQAALVAGRTQRTLALTGELLTSARDAATRTGAVRLRSQVELHAGDVRAALDHLVEAAELLAGEDPSAATTLLGDAVEAAALLGEPSGALEAAGRAVALSARDADEVVAQFAMGQALRLADRPGEARRHLERSLALLSGCRELRGSIRAAGRGATAAGWLGHISEGLAHARIAVELSRDQGAFGPLAHALEVTAELHARAGRWPEAEAYASEGLERARGGGCAWAAVRCLEHLAWLDAVQGREERCRAHAAEAETAAENAGFRSDGARAAAGLLELGLGRPDAAAQAFTRAAPPHLDRGDLVEALARSGRMDDARAHARRLGDDGDEAVAHRCAGLLAPDEHAAAHFDQALESHGQHDRFGRARTLLCYGERLRRAGRRVDARVRLRAAHEGFDQLGARPWAARAATELRATGERLGRREARRGDELTAQELQVALQAAEGRTNKEIGAALYLSPKTVDFHLRRVFRKLDVRARGELIRHFAVAGH